MLRFSFKLCRLLPIMVLAALLVCLMPASALADVEYYNGYAITGYDVHVKVNENNVYDITEKISTDFASPKHGIYRDIPVVSQVQWEINNQKVTRTYRPKVSNISVADGSTGEPVQYQKSRDGDNLELKIGDPDQTFTGGKTYVIRYSLDVGADGVSQFDELYYNIIGNSWDTSIQNMTFSIDMPKSFDKSLLNFAVGAEGSADRTGVDYSVSGNTISGKVTRALEPGEGVTARLELPNGYFTSVSPDTGSGWIILFLAFSLLAVILFLMFGKDSRVYPTVEVGAPDDISPAEAGFIIDGSAQTRDAVSLIIYWANKGYLSILDDKSENFTLKKLRDADDGMRPYEKYMFGELFKGRDEVTSADLQYYFHDTMEQVLGGIRDEYSTPSTRLYTKSGDIAKAVCYILAGLSTGIMLGRGLGDYFFSSTVGMIAGLVTLAATAFLAGVVGFEAEQCRGRPKFRVAATALLYGVVVCAAMFVAAAFTGELLAAAFAAVAAVVCGVVGSYCKKRSTVGNRLLGTVLGLRRFIILCEKKRIETLVEETPSLFYDILPYAFALNIVNKWAEKFNNIALAPPQWYSGGQGVNFNTILFASMLSSNLNSYQTSMTSTPPSSPSSGGFGGGGFSGGGFGGGGGGSW